HGRHDGLGDRHEVVAAADRAAVTRLIRPGVVHGVERRLLDHDDNTVDGCMHGRDCAGAGDPARGERHVRRGHQAVMTWAVPGAASGPISAAIRLASSISVCTMSASGTVLMTSPLTKICPLPLPDATPRSAARASPGPLPTQPITATRNGTSIPVRPAVTSSASLYTSTCARPHDGHDTISRPRCRSPNDSRI